MQAGAGTLLQVQYIPLSIRLMTRCWQAEALAILLSPVYTQTSIYEYTISEYFENYDEVDDFLRDSTAHHQANVVP